MLLHSQVVQLKNRFNKYHFESNLTNWFNLLLSNFDDILLNQSEKLFIQITITNVIKKLLMMNKEEFIIFIKKEYENDTHSEAIPRKIESCDSPTK